MPFPHTIVLFNGIGVVGGWWGTSWEDAPCLLGLRGDDEGDNSRSGQGWKLRGHGGEGGTGGETSGPELLQTSAGTDWSRALRRSSPVSSC